MNRTFCYFALVLSFVVSAISVTFALLPSSGPDAAKVRLFACSVAVAAVWSGYRAWHHLRHPQEPKGWEGTKAKIEQMSSSSEVVRNFFDPRETRFRTLWSIVIIIFLALFCPPVYAWIMALLLLCLKGWTLCSEIRYFKAYHRLQELENAPVPWDYHHEDASMTVEGEDIVITTPAISISAISFNYAYTSPTTAKTDVDIYIQPTTKTSFSSSSTFKTKRGCRSMPKATTSPFSA